MGSNGSSSSAFESAESEVVTVSMGGGGGGGGTGAFLNMGSDMNMEGVARFVGPLSFLMGVCMGISESDGREQWRMKQSCRVSFVGE